MADEDPQPLTAEEVAQLRAELEAVKAERALYRQQAAESDSRATQMAAQAHNAQAGTRSAQIAQLSAQETAAGNTITSIDQELRGLKTELAALNAEGKFPEAADIQEKIGDATARRREAMRYKEHFQSQRAQIEAAPSSPVEQYLAERRGAFSEPAVAWIRAHPRFATDPPFNARVQAAHNEALQKGVAESSPEYFELLERRGYQRPDPTPTQPQPPPQAQPAPSGYEPQEPEAEPTEPSFAAEERAAVNHSGPAFNRAAQNPQPAAAGAGSLRTAIAGSPTRRTAAQAGRVVHAALTPEEWETALGAAPHMAPEDVLKGGQPAIGVWWQELKNGPIVRRMKENFGG
jgi:hypothetical protein